MGFVPFTFVDLIDIILVAVIMYWIYRMTKGTNAPYILSGIIAVYLLWVVVRALNMELLSTILGQLISVGAIALIIVFQPELRRFLQMIGMRQKHFNFITRIFSTGEDTVQTNVVPIVTACREMSETKTGALIVIGQQSDLRLIAEGGIALDAKVSTSLIKNIFFKNAPLHDGAALIDRLETLGPTRELTRKLRRYSVNLPKNVVFELLKDGRVEESAKLPGVYVQRDPLDYDAVFGYDVYNDGSPGKFLEI